MQEKVIKLELYNRYENICTTNLVRHVGENRYRMAENDLFDERLAYGTEFEAMPNKAGKYEVTAITKPSEFITKRMMLSAAFNKPAFSKWGDEIMEAGGFWQLDFCGMLIINLPKGSRINIDDFLRELKR